MGCAEIVFIVGFDDVAPAFRVATHILAFEDDGEVIYYEGNFSDYDEDHKKRKGDSAMVPQRMKYKKLA